MKFMMMMNMTPPSEGDAEKDIRNWPPKDVQTHIQFMMDFNNRLKASGELVGAEGLAWPAQAKLVRASPDGTPVTDGVFPESKEFLIGYWIVDVESPERAYQLAAEASAAPGRGGVPLRMPIEVRQIMGGPPEME